MNFNLVDKAWIPVIDANGIRREIGIREAIVDAHRIAELRDESPLVTAALHRMLLAVLHRVYDGPESTEQWIRIWTQGRHDPERTEAYLLKWQHRFDLFDRDYPFYQVSNLGVDKLTPVTTLAQERAGGNNATLFDHTVDPLPVSFTPAESTRALVGNQAFAIGGGRSPSSERFGPHPNRSHGPLIGGVTVLLKGDSLFETLMLNLLTYSEYGDLPLRKSPEDMPAWERDSVNPPGERVPEGWLDTLTWQSRYVLFIPDDTSVTEMQYTSGESLPSPENRPRDPMWFYALDAKDATKQVTVRVNPDKALWRSADSLFAITANENTGNRRRPLAFRRAALELNRRDVIGNASQWRCSLIGLANDKAKVLLWTHQDLPVPIPLLNSEELVQRLQMELNYAEGAGHALERSLWLLSSLLLSPDEETAKPQSEDIKSLRDSLQGEPRYWGALERPFKQLIVALPGNTDEASKTWRETVRKVVWKTFDITADNSLGGSSRELQARVRAGEYLASGLRQRRITGKEEHTDD